MDFLFLQNFSWMIVLMLWTIPWKGFALWKSARRGDTWWFVALLVLNTAAVLEILYIFVFSKDKEGVEVGDLASNEKI